MKLQKYVLDQIHVQLLNDAIVNERNIGAEFRQLFEAYKTNF